MATLASVLLVAVVSTTTLYAEAARTPVAKSFTVYINSSSKVGTDGKKYVDFYMQGKTSGKQQYNPLYVKEAGCPIQGHGFFQRDSGWFRYVLDNADFVGQDCVKYRITDAKFNPLSNVATVTIVIQK